jgi:hypothetical protein
MVVTQQYCLLGWDTVWSLRNLPVFQGNLLPPSSRHTENRDSRFIQYTGKMLQDYIVPHSRIQFFSEHLLFVSGPM